ncbi:MAG: cytochrome c oxidase subunit 3 [Pseudomonadota bacterium]
MNSPDRGESRSPAEDGVWMFVLGDLVVFTIFFITFLVYRSDSEAAYSQAQLSLSTQIGTANTLALLTSSWLLALGVHRVRDRSAHKARHFFLGSLVLGSLFLVGKISEYVQKISAGIGESEAEFFMFYFVFTGIHFVHVVIGLVILGVLILTIRADELGDRHLSFLEGGAIYWHMVDLLWIFLFALFYLI